MTEQEYSVKDFIKYCSNKIDKNQIETCASQLKSCSTGQIDNFKNQLLQELTHDDPQMFAHCYANVMFICSKYFSTITNNKIDSLWSQIISKLLPQFIWHIQKFPDSNDKKHALHINKVIETWKSKKLFNTLILSEWEKLLSDELQRIDKLEIEIQNQSTKKIRKRSFAETIEPLPHTDASPSDIINDMSPPYPASSEPSAISQSIRYDMIQTIYLFIYKLFEPLGRTAGQPGGSEQIYWKILTISAFWLLHNYEDRIEIADDSAAIGFACIYLAGKAEHYFIKTDKLRSMAQRVVKDCFGSEELSKDKDIFRYELKLLQCIEFNINHIQNPIPLLRTWELDKMIDHSMFLRVLEQLYQYAVLCESKIWEFSKEMIALVFLLVQVGCRMDGGRLLRDRLKVVLAPKKIIDLLRAEYPIFTALLKIVEGMNTLPLVNPTAFYETLYELCHKIMNPPTMTTSMAHSSEIVESTESKTKTDSSAVIPSNTTEKKVIGQDKLGRISINTNPSNPLSPATNITWTPEIPTSYGGSTETQRQQQQAIDELLATCSTPDDTKESSPELRQATREDSFIEDLVENKASLDEAIEYEVLKASKDHYEEDDDFKDDVKGKRKGVRVDAASINKHHNKNTDGGATPLDEEIITPPPQLTIPRSPLAAVQPLKSILPLQRQTSNPKKHVQIEEKHSTRLPTTTTMIDPEYISSSTIDDHQHTTPIEEESVVKKEVDPYAYRRMGSSSPAMSIATTTGSFSPSRLLDEYNNNAPFISMSRQGSRTSRANSINTLPLNELTLSLSDPTEHENENDEVSGDERDLQQQQHQSLPDDQQGMTMTRQNAVSTVQLAADSSAPLVGDMKTSLEKSNQREFSSPGKVVTEANTNTTKEESVITDQAAAAVSTTETNTNHNNNHKKNNIPAKKVVTILQPTSSFQKYSSAPSTNNVLSISVSNTNHTEKSPTDGNATTPTSSLSSGAKRPRNTMDIMKKHLTSSATTITTGTRVTTPSSSGGGVVPLSERLSKRLSSSQDTVPPPPPPPSEKHTFSRVEVAHIVTTNESVSTTGSSSKKGGQQSQDAGAAVDDDEEGDGDDRHRTKRRAYESTSTSSASARPQSTLTTATTTTTTAARSQYHQDDDRTRNNRNHNNNHNNSRNNSRNNDSRSNDRSGSDAAGRSVISYAASRHSSHQSHQNHRQGHGQGQHHHHHQQQQQQQQYHDDEYDDHHTRYRDYPEENMQNRDRNNRNASSSTTRENYQYKNNQATKKSRTIRHE